MTDSIQWWLIEPNQYGNVGRLADGPHEDRRGVEKALYLIQRLGLGRNKKYAAARIEISEVHAAPHDANEDSISTLNSIGLVP